MMDIILDVLADAALDTLKIFPFLLVTYLIMEFIEHKTGDKAKNAIKNSGKIGPLLGAVIGVVPQCGFSAAASSLYAGRIITVGTLLAVYLSTSDEMLPIFISEQVPIDIIFKILGLKVLIGVVAGFLVDILVRIIRKSQPHTPSPEIEHLCEHDHCHCDEGIVKSAIIHALKITFWILIINIALGMVIAFVGEDSLSSFMTSKPVVGEVLAGLIGLIPNCAASVVITELYLDGVLGFGAMMSGLLVGAGVGLIVLFRTNDNIKKNIQITLVLYIIGVISGILFDLIGITV